MLKACLFLAVLPVWLSAGPALACAPLAAADAAALTLAAVQARVADCHPDVLAAGAALGGAVADVQVAGQRPNPQLTLGAGSVGTVLGSGAPWDKTFDHSVRLDQLIERGGKPGLRQGSAQAALQAANADLADARRRAVQAVAHAHLDLWSAQGRVTQLAAAAALGVESLRAIDRRVLAGDAPALDATRLRLDDARLRADLRQARADVVDFQHALAWLIGAPDQAGQLLALLPDAGQWPAPAPDAAWRRPDVVAAQARVAAAEQARDLAAAARTRDVNVGVQFDRWPTSPANGSGTGNTLSVSLSVPLFVRHGYEGERARAEADLAATRLGLARAESTAASELARAVSRAVAASERRKLVAEQLEPAAERVAAGAEIAYQRGAIGALEWLEARRSLRAVRLERIAVDAELAKALADWQASAAPLDAIKP